MNLHLFQEPALRWLPIDPGLMKPTTSTGRKRTCKLVRERPAGWKWAPLPTPQGVSPPLPTSVPRGSHYRPKLPSLPLVSRPPRSLRSAPGSPPEARLSLRSLLRLPRSAAPPPRSPDRARRSAHRAPRSERALDPSGRGAGAVTATATAQGLRGREGAAELNTASSPTERRCGRARLPHLIRACDLTRLAAGRCTRAAGAPVRALSSRSPASTPPSVLATRSPLFPNRCSFSGALSRHGLTPSSILSSVHPLNTPTPDPFLLKHSILPGFCYSIMDSSSKAMCPTALLKFVSGCLLGDCRFLLKEII
uniref:serine/arginine repetitive matrix protein 1-like n=1 Tax=Macaca mulatta TaxID=9544 RepID=UPI0010A290A0|nr:serine/arginine repetitive matrix protein 1-like [Macaca mulatta]